MLLGLAVAEGLFGISLPKDGFPSHLKILGGKMDPIFVFGVGEVESRGKTTSNISENPEPEMV